MTGRPDPVAIRAAARQIARAAEDLDHDASIAAGCISRLEGRWTGSAALVHAGAIGDYARGLRATATLLRQVARESAAVALHLDRGLVDLARLEAQRASATAAGSAAVSHLDVRIEEVWTSIRRHQARFALSLDSLDLRQAAPAPGGRMRTGPVRVPELGVVDPGRMRTGPVRPVGAEPRADLWNPGYMRTGPVRRIGAEPRADLWDHSHLRTGPVRRLLAVHRPVILP